MSPKLKLTLISDEDDPQKDFKYNFVLDNKFYTGQVTLTKINS